MRPTFMVMSLWLAGCTAGVTPAESPPPAETSTEQATTEQATHTPSAHVSPSQAGSASSPAPVCEPDDDGAIGPSQVVSATANIFGAGREVAPAPGEGGAGALPPVWALPRGSTVVTFPCVIGEVTPNANQMLRNGPGGDRLGAGGENTDVTSHEGISGIVNRGNGMFVVGVFLTDVEPSDPAPDRLDFTDAEDFEQLAPEIGQTFLIGDGVGRTYQVPAGATRVFVGFADALLYEGAPGWYGNNAGKLDVTVAVEAD